MSDANRRIEELARNFVAQLTEIAKEEVVNLLGGWGSSGRTGKATRTASSSSRGQKRTSKSLEALQSKFHTFVVKHPGLRVEQINKQLGTTTKDLQLPIRKLIAEGQLKAKGSRRSTTYFAGAKKAKK